MGKKVFALIAFGLVTVTAAGALGAVAYTGHAVVSRLSEQTAALKKSFPGLQLEEQIERGLLHTTRTVTLRIGCAPLPTADGKVGQSGPLEVRWRDRIKHGPMRGDKSWNVAAIDSELLLPESLAGELKPLTGGKPVLTVHTLLGFDRTFTSDLAVPSMKVAQAQGSEMDFSGLRARATGTIPEGKGTFRYRFVEEPLSFNGVTPEGTLKYEIGAVEMTGTVAVDPNATGFLMPFENQFGIEALKMSTTAPNPEGGPPVTVVMAFTGMKASAGSKIDRELCTLSNRVSGKVAINGFTIDKFEFGTAIRRLHVPTYTQLMSSMIALGFSCDARPDPNDPSAVFAALSQPAFALLAHDPEYEVGPMAFEFGDKRAELSYSIGTHGITPADKDMPLPMLLMLKAVVRAHAKADLRLIDDLANLAAKTLAEGSDDPQAAAAAPPAGTPNPMAEMARGMIDEFVTKGYLVREGDAVRASFESAGGQFKLNGKPFEMPDLDDMQGP